MKPFREIRRAWRLYQTDSRGDTLLAVVLVAAAVLPFVYTWWQMRQGGERNV